MSPEHPTPRCPAPQQTANSGDSGPSTWRAPKPRSPRTCNSNKATSVLPPHEALASLSVGLTQRGGGGAGYRPPEALGNPSRAELEAGRAERGAAVETRRGPRSAPASPPLTGPGGASSCSAPTLPAPWKCPCVHPYSTRPPVLWMIKTLTGHCTLCMCVMSA